MRTVLITPPAVDPVPLAEAKLYLRIDHDDEDELIRRLVSAATHLVEAASGRALIDRTWRVILAGWPASGRLRLPISPVRDVLALRTRSVDGQPTPLPVGAVGIEAASDPPALWLRQPLPTSGFGPEEIEIDLLAGYGPAPEQTPQGLRLAVLRLAAGWFENRGDAGGEPARLPPAIMALVAPHRLARL